MNTFVERFSAYTTPPHPCNYLPNRQAITLFIDPEYRKDIFLYENLLQHGFRRSGEYLYRPDCDNCQACIPTRLPVHSFTPRRVQQRIWKKNNQLRVIERAGLFRMEHFKLYCRYLEARHPGGGMDNPTPKDYMQFLTSSWSNTVFYEFRLKQELVAIAVVDQVETALSAVYTFFDPNYSSYSLGTYAILWEIEEVKRLNMKWLYLGYWIKDCQKMKYKGNYQPLEIYHHGVWEKSGE